MEIAGWSGGVFIGVGRGAWRLARLREGAFLFFSGREGGFGCVSFGNESGSGRRRSCGLVRSGRMGRCPRVGFRVGARTTCAAVSRVGNGSSTWDLKFQIIILRHVIFINKWVKSGMVMQIELAAYLVPPSLTP
jgi:hypothetical protein